MRPQWWARVGSPTRDAQGRRDYGSWVPTGCPGLAEAKDYMKLYYPEAHVLEWLEWQ